MSCLTTRRKNHPSKSDAISEEGGDTFITKLTNIDVAGSSVTRIKQVSHKEAWAKKAPSRQPEKSALDISDLETKLLFQAKCRDLDIPEVDCQYQKFRENFLLASKDRAFKMTGAHIAATTTKVIALIMLKNENFCKYELNNNKIGDEGCKILSQVLYQNPPIIQLNLSSNAITDVGLTLLMKALTHNHCLIDLNISSKTKEGKNRNKFSPAGFMALKDMLKHNRFLQILNISGNNLRSQGVRILCDAYEGSTKE